MAKSRANGNKDYVNNNYNANVVDAVGVPILPIVKTFSARGLDSIKWGYDRNGLIVETGWSAKIDLYRTINDTSQPVSARVQAIDTRVITLVSDAKTYMAAYQAYADAQKEIDELYAMIPHIFSLGLSQASDKTAGAFSLVPGIFLTGVKLLAKSQKPDDYKVIMQQLQKKLIHLESEVGALGILKSSLTGEYAKFDKVVSDAGRSANIATNNWLWIGIGLLVLFILIKRKQA
ncbi:hypothetical protein [Emticicia soli]|uniref:Uncharacterized protein n=1 Tax=Emticicia soli TaxID=2027878 RepID=A0ABW5J8M9_9BACT